MTPPSSSASTRDVVADAAFGILRAFIANYERMSDELNVNRLAI
jgi:hypothetical protein